MAIQHTSINVDCLRQRNPAIMAELLDTYGDALYGSIIRIVHSRQLADDVLQDTLLKVWKNGEHYDVAKGRLFTWLLNIARNTAIDATRTAHFQRRRNIEPFSESTCQPEPENSYVPSDYLDLSTHLARLDKKYRVLVELAYFKGYTHEEISKETGIPLGTIKTRLYNALEKLRAVFPKELVYN